MKKILILLLLPIFSFGQVNTFPWTNDFESYVALQDDLNDDGNWGVMQGPTSSFATGPSGDHTTGSGVYYYVESSAPNYPNQTFIAYTPTFDVSATPGKVLVIHLHLFMDVWILFLQTMIQQLQLMMVLVFTIMAV